MLQTTVCTVDHYRRPCTMDNLQEWKAALASGVKIETLLGLESDKSKTNEQQPPGGAKPKEEPQNIGVKTFSGQFLEFQWSSPSLTAICPDLSKTGEPQSSSLPATMLVSPPSIPVEQILGPCFIDLSSGHGKEDQQSKPATSKHSSTD